MGFRDFLGQLFGETGEEKTKEKVPDVAHPIQVVQEQPRVEARTTRHRTPEHLRTPEEGVLETREKSGKRALVGGVNTNTVEFISLEDDGGGVFKPKAGEVEVYDGVRVGTYYRRERAAYLIDRFIGFDLVPPTVIREIDASVGSFQEFITDAIAYGEISSDGKRKLSTNEQLIKLWIFDHLISNPDRHGYNLLIKDERIHAIDHGCSLGSEATNFRLWNADGEDYVSFYDRAIPQDIIDQVQKLAHDPNGRAILRDLLRELLSEKEVDAFLVRLDRIAKMLEKGYIAKSEAEEFTRFD